MTKPTIKIHDVSTDEVIERDMTTAEIAQYTADLAAVQSEMAAAEARQTEKSALLARLGLTEDEARLLLS